MQDSIGTAMKLLHLQELVKISETKDLILNSTLRNVLIIKGNFIFNKGQINQTMKLATFMNDTVYAMGKVPVCVCYVVFSRFKNTIRV